MLIKKKEFDQKNRKINRKKSAKNKKKTTLDLIPIKSFTNEQYIEFVDGVYSQVYKMNTVALNDISFDENSTLMSNFAYLLRVYDDSIKIVSSNFHTQTKKQINYWQERLFNAEANGDEKRIQAINEIIIVLKLISKEQINKEHYLQIFASSIKELEDKIYLLLNSCSNLIYTVPLTVEQKRDLFADFNNPRVFE
ncbi:hypothetical protein O0G33_07115 [Staphylococcus pseudintermedius]|uniref:hypothetical protein n=1 Tax=Staphylococcus pseudintermedius TaxID=283734 RepID=UPI0018EF3946|nr:hypothetical protein [Staphylococcus pseudintermedius]EJA1908395.1 hypothetical protein [Staphylococcus pseudintermedius]ELP8704794.1 hypothetical protein [Staphylococcus pseudintermedius]MDK4179945.1 hypothetical protein [Staphylococcus pseudintermedius]QQJ80542.1 hypothetical protein JGZ56_08995 [Staphylococcus pseudintermedius]HAR6315346.1 hypothetical protein [Staphylococcus pseudintermedius]